MKYLEDLTREGRDIIDSRNVEKRISDLESERQDLEDLLESATEDNAAAGGETEKMEAARLELEMWDSDYEEELTNLKALREDVSSSEWTYGLSLIADHYFQDYAEDLADDIGAIDRNQNWPMNCIDWKEAAKELQQDYSSVEYGSTTYWYRA